MVGLISVLLLSSKNFSERNKEKKKHKSKLYFKTNISKSLNPRTIK